MAKVGSKLLNYSKTMKKYIINSIDSQINKALNSRV